MAKLLENTFRAVNISLANEVADVCQRFGLNPVEVIDAAATKPFGFMAPTQAQVWAVTASRATLTTSSGSCGGSMCTHR